MLSSYSFVIVTFEIVAILHNGSVVLLEMFASTDEYYTLSGYIERFHPHLLFTSISSLQVNNQRCIIISYSTNNNPY